MKNELINKGSLATELGLEKVAKKDLLSTPKAGGQFMDDIYGYIDEPIYRDVLNILKNIKKH